MRILVLGAGAVGGYFGGRLLEKGEDVTFLVREKRNQQLRERGLVIKSIHGDVVLHPQTLVTGQPSQPFDLILVSTKSYHLQSAINDLKPYVGEQTVILPLLNGVGHIETLQEAFGKEKVIGGLCFIETTLNEKGEVVQTSPIHDVVFGEFSGEKTTRITYINEAFRNTKANFRLSEHIVQDMWHKYLFITTLSGVTTLMRAPIGPIRDVKNGWSFIEKLCTEAANIMRAEQAPIHEDIVQKHMKTMKNMTYAMKSSMQRDMEKGYLVEADHLQGYLLTLANKHGLETPLLEVVYQNLKIYEMTMSS
ncbi:2-dehydropantoate 2-reductase [Bacillus songklensis]|uniref:2-dehydropantoate 2-reductase n=1 Tax=Bacillus songklensis TaxID=1069116 RepID=A0ABV8AW77_9BACI